MVVHPAAELGDDAVVRLASLVGNVPWPDQEVAIRTKTAVNIVHFRAELKGSLAPVVAVGVGKADAERGLTKGEPPKPEVSPGGKTIVQAFGGVGGRRNIPGRIVERRIEVGFYQRIKPIDVDLTSTPFGRG